MKKSENNFILLVVIFVVALLTSNIISSNGMINTNITIGNITLSTSAGLLAYAITFLITDIIGQIWGKKEANKTVLYGFIG